MATLVLVHGAWQSASTWDPILPSLRDAGHAVYVPTLTGLGTQAHQLCPEVNLEVHIRDVVGLLSSEDLADVTLVGHSYAGMIITGVSEEAAERLARLVYVDAFVPEDGQSAMQLLPKPFQEKFRDEAAAQGDGWRLPASDAKLDIWGLKEGPARDFVRSHLCDFTINCFDQPIRLPTNASSKIPRVFIACVAEEYPARVAFQPFSERAKREGWAYHELPTGHDCHAEMPDEFAKLLLGLV